MKTKVIFRTTRGKNPEVMAIFPEIPSDRRGYECAFYCHVGQHGGGDRHGLIRVSKPAKKEEFEPLLKELGRVGYTDLEIVKRITWKMDKIRMADAQEIKNNLK